MLEPKFHDLEDQSDAEILKLIRQGIAILADRGWEVAFPKHVDAYSCEDYAGHFTCFKNISLVTEWS